VRVFATEEEIVVEKQPVAKEEVRRSARTWLRTRRLLRRM
jgi:hypothetical protein